MNIFKGLMFLDGHRIPLEYVDDVVAGTEAAPSYAQGYGNATASARRFGADHYARRPAAGPAPEAPAAAGRECPVGGCA